MTLSLACVCVYVCACVHAHVCVHVYMHVLGIVSYYPKVFQLTLNIKISTEEMGMVFPPSESHGEELAP